MVTRVFSFTSMCHSETIVCVLSLNIPWLTHHVESHNSVDHLCLGMLNKTCLKPCEIYARSRWQPTHCKPRVEIGVQVSLPLEIIYKAGQGVRWGLCLVSPW